MSLKYWSSIIEAAARSPLGLSALIILMLGFLAYEFFRSASVETRERIFKFTSITSVVLFVIAIQTIPPVEQWSPPPNRPSESKLPPCDVVLFGPCSE